MSELKEPGPAKLVMAMIYSTTEVLGRAREILINRYGPIDQESAEFEFTHTRYYNDEMGEGLKKCLIAFVRLIRPKELPEIKIFTHNLEQKFAEAGNRRINIDPGYFTLDRFILATGKDTAHRIYLKDGIFAELELIYQSGNIQPLPWTYPDYRSSEVIEYFNRLRPILKNQAGGRTN